MRAAAHSSILVDTDWVAAHLDDPDVRLVECNDSPLLYGTGHIPGAVRIDWVDDMNEQALHEYLDAARFAELLESRGIAAHTTVVFYGDKHNWWATYALWMFKLFGHQHVRLLNGGRATWVAEGRPLTRELPAYQRTVYLAQPYDGAASAADAAQPRSAAANVAGPQLSRDDVWSAWIDAVGAPGATNYYPN